MEISQSEISTIISDLFLTNEAQKRNKQRYLSLIKNGSYAGLPLLIQALKNIFSNSKTVPHTRLLALHFLQEAVNLNTQQLLLYVKKSIYPLLLEDAKFQKEKKDDDRGKYFFSQTPDATTKTQGNSYLRLLLECIEVWAKWYRQDEVFSQGYIQLSQLGVKFPSERIYLKNINENPKVPLETERGDESDDNEGVLMLGELVDCKVKLRRVLLEKEVDENKLMEIIGKFKVFLDKIELNMFKNKGSKSLDDEKKFLEAILKSYKYSVKNSERKFDTLKESYFLLTGESPPKSQSQILKPRIQIPERSPNSSMNNSSIKKSRQIRLDVQLLRTDLLTTKELLTENLDKHRKSIREKPETIGPIVDFLVDLLTDSCEKAMTRYLSLFLLKSLMTLETDLLLEPIAIKALPKIVEIAKFNSRSKATDRYCQYFGNTVNENIERLANDFVRLAIDCVYDWAKQYPSKSNGNDSLFMENYLYLKELGVAFEGSGMVCSEEIENDVVEHNNTKKYDEGLIEEHLKVVNGQMEDLKAFLIKTKKTVKDTNFLPNMLEILQNEQEILAKIPFSTSNLKEAEGFIKEFRKRFQKFEGGMINYTQFKKRFLKFFGLADGISSKISSKSKMSTSDLTMEKEKPEKNGNRNQDLADKQIFMKIPQKNVMKEIDILEDDLFADFSKTVIISQENIKGYFQLLARDLKKNLEILAFCAKPIFEDPETHYIEKLNYLNLLRKCVDSSDLSIIQFIHDYLMRSFVLAIFNANFYKSSKSIAQIQEEFRLMALESLRDWGLKHKQNITLGNFKKCWDLLVEELMIEVPDRFFEKSSVLLDARKKSNFSGNNNSAHLNINFEKSYRFSKDSITLNGVSINKESVQIPEFHDKSKGIEDILNQLNKDSATIKEKGKISFSIIFSNDKEKIPLKGFSCHINNRNGNMKNSNINRFFKNDQKINLEAKLIKENIDLKSQIQKRDAQKLMLEKELKTLKERLKIFEKK